GDGEGGPRRTAGLEEGAERTGPGRVGAAAQVGAVPRPGQALPPLAAAEHLVGDEEAREAGRQLLAEDLLPHAVQLAAQGVAVERRQEAVVTAEAAGLVVFLGSEQRRPHPLDRAALVQEARERLQPAPARLPSPVPPP